MMEEQEGKTDGMLPLRMLEKLNLMHRQITCNLMGAQMFIDTKKVKKKKAGNVVLDVSRWGSVVETYQIHLVVISYLC